MNYKFGSKNNWRRTMWNEIKCRLRVPTSEALVLYLSGEDNLDRAVALEKGFKPWNLISVERDYDVCKKIRENGQLCINADFLDVIYNWTNKRKLDVVFGDFVSPITDKIMFNECEYAGPHVYAFNNLAGRETDKYAIKSGCINLAVDLILQHRWKRAILLKNYALYCKQEHCIYTNFQDYIMDLVKSARFKFLSYISTSNQRFDSVIYSARPCRVNNDWLQRLHTNNDARNKSAAIMAIRKMQMQKACVNESFYNIEAKNHDYEWLQRNECNIENLKIWELHLKKAEKSILIKNKEDHNALDRNSDLINASVSAEIAEAITRSECEYLGNCSMLKHKGKTCTKV